MSAVLSRLFITPRVSILFQWLVNKTSIFFRFSSFFPFFFFDDIQPNWKISYGEVVLSLSLWILHPFYEYGEK